MTEPQDITDAQALRALAHPIRLALLDVMRTQEEITASRAAELLGENPGNMSWHLQTLARYGFVEETGTGKGRSRPWRLVERIVRFDASADHDPETAAAGEALESALISRSFAQLEEWRRRRPGLPVWAEQSFLTSVVAHVTPEELGAIAAQISELFRRYADRPTSDRPPGAEPVTLLGVGHPMGGPQLP